MKISEVFDDPYANRTTTVDDLERDVRALANQTALAWERLRKKDPALGMLTHSYLAEIRFGHMQKLWDMFAKDRYGQIRLQPEQERQFRALWDRLYKAKVRLATAKFKGDTENV